MGKHERSLVEEAEKYIVAILNHDSGSMSRRDPWSSHAIAIAKKIITDYPNFSCAEHRGNDYSDIGDIVLTLQDSTSVYIEAKMSERTQDFHL